ncbi:hypothetical protein HDU98_004276 [Podochytrium sp. JEL0797]|nr:hypothetical protein HDU98_004276 [Podochytrium sp. JEL0797]
MLVVDPAERIPMSHIFQHRWFTSVEPKNSESFKYLADDITNQVSDTTTSTLAKFQPLTTGLNDPDALDLEVVSSLGFLGWTGNEKGLLQALLSNEKNMEKVFYNLLCRKKWESFENYGGDNFSSWDLADGAKRRVGSFSNSPNGSVNSGTCSPSMSRIDIYKSELCLVRKNSSSADSLVDDSEYSETGLPTYSDTGLAQISTLGIGKHDSSTNLRLNSPLSKFVNVSEDSENASASKLASPRSGSKSSSALADSATLRSELRESKAVPLPSTPQSKRTPPGLRSSSDPHKNVSVAPIKTGFDLSQSSTTIGHRKLSLYDDGESTTPTSSPKKRWFKGFHYTPPEICLISTHEFASTADAAALRLHDLKIKYQTDDYGIWRCKFEQKSDEQHDSLHRRPTSPFKQPNFMTNFTRKLSLSMKGSEGPESLSHTLVDIQKSSSSTPKSVKFKMEVKASVELSGGCKIVFTHQQGSYSLLQSVVGNFKEAWPLSA